MNKPVLSCIHFACAGLRPGTFADTANSRFRWILEPELPFSFQRSFGGIPNRNRDPKGIPRNSKKGSLRIHRDVEEKDMAGRPGDSYC